MDASTAISPLDGRYRRLTEPLAGHLSEFALNRARLEIEVEWLLHLGAAGVVPGLRPLTGAERAALRSFAASFDAAAAARLAEIEKRTGHDVKAVEYLLKEFLAGTSAADVAEFVHFCCTSEDVNNLAYGRMLRQAVGDVWLPRARAVHGALVDLAVAYRDRAMLSRTHGQPATPTTLGKEVAVFAYRLARQIGRIERQEYLGKINGATGTYGAHAVACPGVDWERVSREFVGSLGLVWNPLTTQIEPHDYMAELFSDVARFDAILHNLATDVWHYISLGYFRQAAPAGTVGSSTMPHKVNPIKFENAEANLEVANALFRCLADTLVTSRLQRDLSDSSMQRNIGAAFGHSLIALENVLAGLGELDVDPAALDRDLDGAWAVLGEAVQTVMRRVGMDSPYERLKELTRGVEVDRERLAAFVRAQGLPADDEARLLALTPADYVGLAPALVEHARDAR